MKTISFEELMKKLNFVADTDCYTRKFTRIYEMPDGLYIGHTISKSKTKFNLKDIDLWLNYFDRI